MRRRTEAPAPDEPLERLRHFRPEDWRADTAAGTDLDADLDALEAWNVARAAYLSRQQLAPGAYPATFDVLEWLRAPITARRTVRLRHGL